MRMRDVLIPGIPPNPVALVEVPSINWTDEFYVSRRSLSSQEQGRLLAGAAQERGD
jgi:hypothetical protein